MTPRIRTRLRHLALSGALGRGAAPEPKETDADPAPDGTVSQPKANERRAGMPSTSSTDIRSRAASA